jgi:ABC-2 type transport system ATP-binding protein
MSKISIQVSQLSRHFGAVIAVNAISFSVKEGEIVGFLGPNGAGKSTTMRILCGLMTATSGQAWVAGIPVAVDPQAVKRKIGYMPENNPLPLDMRVAEYLRFRARLKEVPGPKVRLNVDEVMEICDLAKTARRKVIGTLSKGFRQRVGIADALLGSPEVIIMDEPTIGLDPHQIQGIRRLIDGLRGRHTVILSSHILPEIERSCDRVIIINRGHLVATGSRPELQQEFLPGLRFSLELKNVDAANRFDKLLADAGIDLSITECMDADEEGFCRYVLEGSSSTGPSGDTLLHWLTQQNGWVVRSFHKIEPTLEAVFLAATKRSWEEIHHGQKAANQTQSNPL